MVAIEATIVSTAMPQIATQLGDLQLYSWVFSSFLLAQTAMTVVFGKLADLFGRKPVVLVGIAIFLIGSVLAGLAWSMPAMIAFRLIQGIGAGAIQPITLTIIGDLYPVRERGKVQGWLASVWAISAVLGPMAGGLIIRDLSWPWIFWINVPIGFAAAAGFIAFLREPERHTRPAIDWFGAVLFTISIGALMMALTNADSARPALVVAEVALFLVFGALFVWQERRAADPMISFALWAHRPIAAMNASALFIGMVLMGLTSFLPVYVQGVLQRSPVVAGLALTMIMVGWPTGATTAARTFHRIGLRRILIGGGFFLPLGALPFALLTPSSSPVTAAIGSLVAGLGMGTSSVCCMVLLQEIVAGSQRGVATASNLFSRNLGSTLGAAVFGAVLNYGLNHAKGLPAIGADQLRQLLGGTGANVATSEPIRLALQHALHMTFVALCIIALAALLATLFVPPVRIGVEREESV
jgi:MFS family permease